MEVLALIVFIIVVWIVVRLARKTTGPPGRTDRIGGEAEPPARTVPKRDRAEPPARAMPKRDRAAPPARTAPQRGEAELPRMVAGMAVVTDGDGLRVTDAAGRRHEIRIAGIDAAEHGQQAQSARTGNWFNEGWWVKNKLVKKVGGQQVRVTVEKRDKFGRLVGQVTCGGEDIGEWLVGGGYAIAAYSDRYKQVQKAACKEKRGRWGFAKRHDPRSHRAWAKEREEKETG